MCDADKGSGKGFYHKKGVCCLRDTVAVETCRRVRHLGEMSDGDGLSTAPEDWRRYVAQLSEIQEERDRLAVELREALRQVEHWRTLAEYRRATLLARQDDETARPHVPRWIDYLLPEQTRSASSD